MQNNDMLSIQVVVEVYNGSKRMKEYETALNTQVAPELAKYLSYRLSHTAAEAARLLVIDMEKHTV